MWLWLLCAVWFTWLSVAAAVALLNVPVVQVAVRGSCVECANGSDGLLDVAVVHVVAAVAV